MKENIDSKNIGNRKFIIELRYDAKVTMLDAKGALVEKILETGVFPCSHWEIGQSNVAIRDTKQKEDALNVALVTLNRINFISHKIDSVESFYANFTKVYDAVTKVLGQLSITRIGCRIIGTYKSKSSDYKDVLKRIGLNFRVERTKKRLSQEQFAELANVHTNYIGKVERGEQNLTVKKIVELTNSLGLSVDKILNF